LHVKNQRVSYRLGVRLGHDQSITIAHVGPSRTKRLLGVLWQLKHAAVISHRRLVSKTFSLLSWAMFFTAVRDRANVCESRGTEE